MSRVNIEVRSNGNPRHTRRWRGVQSKRLIQERLSEGVKAVGTIHPWDGVEIIIRRKETK